MSALAPFERLLDRLEGRRIPLPHRLDRLYGPLHLPLPRARPYVIANAASTLDGVVALSAEDRTSGGDITGFDPHDRALMGLLRAVADVVVVGAGTVRAVPRHRWTAESAFRELSEEFGELRQRLGKEPEPRIVVVTSEGRLDLTLPVFSAPGARALIVTGRTGAARLARRRRPRGLVIRADPRSGPVTAAGILAAVRSGGPSELVLIEGGPHLFGTFVAGRALDEIFLTLSPRLAGRSDRTRRLALIEGRELPSERPLPAELLSARRAGDLLFLRYRLGEPDERLVTPPPAER